MPHYYFHLSFADRLWPDEEGVSLPSRDAARNEAQAIVGELSRRSGHGRRSPWAGWFLRVADDEAEFLVLPLGHPALALVQPEVRNAAEPAEWDPQARSRILAREMLENMQTMARLLDLNRRLRAELERGRRLGGEMRARAQHIQQSSAALRCEMDVSQQRLGGPEL